MPIGNASEPISLLFFNLWDMQGSNFKQYLMNQIDSQSNYPTIKDFVLQQAYEKSFEINVLGLKDFEKEKANIFEQRKEIIQEELDKKHKEQLAAKRIHKSSLINKSRMNKMEARHKNLLNIISSTEYHLKQQIVGDQTKYRVLLKDLIVEGLIKMLEPFVYVRCLRRDSAIVQGVLAEAKVQFQEQIKKEGMDESVSKVEIQLDSRWLEEREVNEEGTDRVAKSQENNKCFGGVILTNEDGLIVCKNTIDARIELAYQHMLPVIRSSLFN